MKRDQSIEEQGFQIIEPRRRRRTKNAPTSRNPLPAIASPTNRIRVSYLKRRHEVLISATYVDAHGQLLAHEAFPIHLGKILKELGITPELIADARLQQKVRDECVAILEPEPEDEDEPVVIH